LVVLVNARNPRGRALRCIGCSAAFGTFLSPKRPVAFFPCRPPEVHAPAHPLDLLFLEMNAFRYALR
jgi:hypothetical protein